MADYYAHFSEILENLTHEEEVWLRNQLEWLETDDWEGPRFQLDSHDYDVSCPEVGFLYEFQDDGKGGRHLWIYSEDSGDPATPPRWCRSF